MSVQRHTKPHTSEIVFGCGLSFISKAGFRAATVLRKHCGMRAECPSA
jgi:hypothetical protein